MRSTLADYQLAFAAVAVVLCGGLLLSCGSDEPRPAFEADAQATAEIGRITKALRDGKKITQQDVDAINGIYERYPAAGPVRQAMQLALISRQDWAELEKFYNDGHVAELSVKSRLNLGKVYIQLGRYQDAVATLEAFEILNDSNDPAHAEATSLLATSHFHLGQYERATELLDGAWPRILGEKRTDDIVTRGMIHFYQGQRDEAIATLEAALAIEPGKVSANNALARIYAAANDQESAEEHLARVQRYFDKMTEEEQSKTQFVSRIYELQTAYEAGRFQDVVDIAVAIIPQADSRTKLVLYQYLYACYEKLGRPDEAQEALAEARRLQGR